MADIGVAFVLVDALCFITEDGGAGSEVMDVVEPATAVHHRLCLR